MNEYRIMPNDIVRHKPSGETWVVCGVNHESGNIIPCGYPFPSVAKIEDCEVIEKRYHIEPQSEEEIHALLDAGLKNYVDVRSAMLHGII